MWQSTLKTGVKAGLYFIGWCFFMAMILFIGDGLKMQLNLEVAALIALILTIVFGILTPRLIDLKANPPHSRLGYDLRIFFFCIVIAGLSLMIGGTAYGAFIGKLSVGIPGMVTVVLAPLVILLSRGVARLRSESRRLST